MLAAEPEYESATVKMTATRCDSPKLASAMQLNSKWMTDLWLFHRGKERLIS